MKRLQTILALAAFGLGAGPAIAAKQPISIANVAHPAPVDFDREISPFLSDNCLSCHSQTTAKGGLNLETPELMLKGGDSGPAITPAKGAESLMLQAAAHLDDDLAMPPRDNKARAKDLTPEQLGLLKLWIDQGAKASPKRERVIAWQPAAQNCPSIYAVDVSRNGQFAACARGSRLFIYHLPTGRLIAAEDASRDRVNAMAFSPDGGTLAVAGYREVRLWRRVPITGRPAAALPTPEGAIQRPDGQRLVRLEGGAARLCSAGGKVIAELTGNRLMREALEERERAVQIEAGNLAARKEAAQAAEKALTASQERSKKSAETLTARQRTLEERRQAATAAQTAKASSDQALASAEEALKAAELQVQSAAAAAEANKDSPDAATSAATAAKARQDRDRLDAERKKAVEKGEAATKAMAAADEAAKKAESDKTSAETELTLAKAEEQKTAGAATEAKAAIQVAETAGKNAAEAAEKARQAAAAAVQPVNVAAFSPDGAWVVTGGEDRLIHTWSAETGAACDVLSGHAAPITALAFSPEGALVSTASDGAALSWDLSPRWKCERTIGAADGPSPFADRVNALAFSPDGQQLATGGGEPSRGGEIKLWNPGDSRLLRDLPKIHSDSVLCLEFSPDGKLLASGGADKMARLIDAASGRVVRSLEGHTHHVLGVSWSANGRTVATAGADALIKIWDTETGDRKKNVDGWEKEVTAVHFLGLTATMVASSGDHKVRIVDVDGKETRVLPEVGDFMQSAASTADGQLVVAGGEDSILRVWKAADGAKVYAFSAEQK